MPKSTCWICDPKLDYGCMRPSGLLCDEHRAIEVVRRQRLVEKYGHLTIDEQNRLLRQEQATRE